MSKRIPIAGFQGLYASGEKIVYRLKNPDGDWKWIWSSFVTGQEPQAFKALEEAKRAQTATAEMFGKTKGGPATLEEYANTKFFPARKDTIQDWKSDETRVVEHVFPFKTDSGKRLGSMALRDVRPRHLIAAFAAFRKKKKLDGKPYAPKSIWNTYGVIKALFRDAILDELLFESPCALDERHLGENTDADPEWREGALYSREELELLIASPLIPNDRQVWSALEGLGAMRLGEAAAIRWRHYDPNLEPLGGLLIARQHDKDFTKTKRVRKMPVHPVLAAILADWRMNGWPLMMGRHPQPDDLIVPASAPTPGKGYRLPLGAMRTEKYVSKRHKEDLGRLGLRHRRSHDLRATFITWALVDGANKVHLESCTHTPKKGKAFDLYNRIPWPAKCEAVAKLKVSREAHTRGELVELRKAAGTVEGRTPDGEELDIPSVRKTHTYTQVVSPSCHPARQVAEKTIENEWRRRESNPCDSDVCDINSVKTSAIDANEFAKVDARHTNTVTTEGGSSQATGDRVTSLLDRALADWRHTQNPRALRTHLVKLLAVLDDGCAP